MSAQKAPAPSLEPGRWPGLDEDFFRRARELSATPRGRTFRSSLEPEMVLHRARGRSWPFAPPVLVKPEHGVRLEALLAAYHRAIETLVAAHREDERVGAAIPIPPELAGDVAADAASWNGRVHFCRLDLLLAADGGFQVIETNANCPGGLLTMGLAARLWRRRFLGGVIELPPAMDHEHTAWVGRWFARIAGEVTGERPGFVAILRQEGGNRAELPLMVEQMRNAGIEAEEADPRELEWARGQPTLRGRPVRHAYLKLGIREMCAMRPALEAFMTMVREGALFVQNGLSGRLIGDNKLCLGVLSDPAFDDLFEAGDLELIRAHLPWSRLLARSPSEQVDEIRSDPERFVLKRPLDTRGRGVVIGRETGRGEAWRRAVDEAAAGGWLVQRYHESTVVERDFEADDVHHHDLCVGGVEGRLAGMMSRGSGEMRMNVARSGRLHPVFAHRSI